MRRNVIVGRVNKFLASTPRIVCEDDAWGCFVGLCHLSASSSVHNFFAPIQKRSPLLPTWASNYEINRRCAWGRLRLWFIRCFHLGEVFSWQARSSLRLRLYNSPYWNFVVAKLVILVDFVAYFSRNLYICGDFNIKYYLNDFYRAGFFHI